MALTRTTKLLAKIESSYGSNPSPVAGSNAIQVTDIEVTPIEADNVQAPTFQGFLGNSTQGTLLANKRVAVSFGAELSGSGAAGTASALSPLLKSCGLSETIASSTSVTYAPVSASFSSCTILCFYGATRHVITGCRGTATISMSAGQFAMINFEFTGIYNAPDSTAMSGTFTVANQSAALEVNDTNTTTATFHGSIVLGATAGNIVTVNVPQTDITGATRADTGGVNALNLPYLALPTTAGNNELSIVMT